MQNPETYPMKKRTRWLSVALPRRFTLRARRPLFLRPLVALALWGASLHAAPQLALGTAIGATGTTAILPLTISGGSNVVGAQWEIEFAGADLSPAAAILAENLANFTVATSQVRPGVQRFLLYSRTGATLPDPAKLQIPIAITQNAAIGPRPLLMRNVLLSNESAEALKADTLVDGLLTITTAIRPRFQSILVDAEGQLQIRLTATAGESYVLQSTADLQVWSNISTNTAVGGVVTITQRVQPLHHFYRALAAP